MILYLGIQFLISVLGFIVLFLFKGQESAASFLSGSLLIFINVLSLTIAWTFITRKKLVAVSVSLIVFKYAILGVIIYRLLKVPWLDRLWMSVGLGSLVITTLLFGLLHSLSSQKEE